MVSQRKIEIVDQLSDEIREAEDLVFTNFKGLSVEELEELRNNLYEHGSRFRVVKNRLAKRAFKEAFSSKDSDVDRTQSSDSATEVDVTEVTGVGPSKVDPLAESGFNTVGELADASTEELAEISGIGEATAEKIIDGAKELVDDNDSASSSESTSTSSGEVIDEVNEFLNGNTALALSGDGYVNVAEVIVEFAEEHENLQVKGGLLDGGALDPDQVESVSELPSRKELLTKLAGTLEKPLQDLVHHLNYPINQLVRTLNELKDQKESSS